MSRLSELKSRLEEIKSEAGQTVTTTVDEFFTWYSGENWENDQQITNTMTVDGEHAQSGSDRGLDWLDFLSRHKNVEITVLSKKVANQFENRFTLAGHKFTIDSLDAFKQSNF